MSLPVTQIPTTKKIIGQFSSLGRAFQITPEGDSRMPFHTTIYLSFCATEIYSFPSGKVKGAPSRLITYNTLQQLDRKCRGKDNVHPEKKTASKIFYQNSMYAMGMEETKEENRESCVSNPYGFACWTTKSVSMTQQIVMDFAIHFAKHLPRTFLNHQAI